MPNSAGTISLVLGILGLLMFGGILGLLMFGLPFGVAAIITGIVAKNKGDQYAQGCANWGIALGIVDCAFAAFVFMSLSAAL